MLFMLNFDLNSVMFFHSHIWKFKLDKSSRLIEIAVTEFLGLIINIKDMDSMLIRSGSGYRSEL